jgi:putative Mn2+ efflux pump MntP
MPNSSKQDASKSYHHMSIFYIFLVAVGLTFDTFAVSVSTGLAVSHIRFWQAARVALVLGLVQAIMPLLGWFAGMQVKELISNLDHWIAFSLLLLLGSKMIYEALKKDTDAGPSDPLKMAVLLGMALATSIDALVVGISFGFLDVNIVAATIIIGATTFVVAMVGMLVGKKAGALLGKKMEIVGGLILIFIGSKILFEHLQ